jgi:hypothetical protein
VKGQEFFNRAIVGLFDVVGEITGGQLVLTPVVIDALTADPLAGARFIRAIAVFFIDRDLAFHCRTTSVQMLNRDR